MLKSESLEIIVPEFFTVNPKSPWIVVHTRSRHEKKLVHCLDLLEIDSYMPLIENKTCRNGRVRSYENPLFSGYVFVAAEPVRHPEIFSSNCVANIIGVFNQQSLVDDISRIYLALKSCNVVATCPFLKTGNKIRFKRGPMQGYEGIVVRRKGDLKVVLNVDILQRAIEVEADVFDLEPVE